MAEIQSSYDYDIKTDYLQKRMAMRTLQVTQDFAFLHQQLSQTVLKFGRKSVIYFRKFGRKSVSFN